MTGRRLFRLGVGVAAGVLLFAPDACAGTYTLSARGKLSAGYDSNALEKVREERRAGDDFLRMEAGAVLQSPSVAAWQPGQLSLRWAADRYRTYREETRFLIDGRARWAWGSAKRTVSFNLNGTRKEHPAAAWRKLTKIDAAFDGAHALTARTQWRWEAGGFRLSTPDEGPADRWSWRVSSSLARQWSRLWRVSVQVEGGRTHLDEAALAAPGTGEEGLLEEDHVDDHIRVGLRAERVAQPRASLSYHLRTIDSNSFGYDQRRHELEGTLALRMPLGATLLAIGRWQEPQYGEDDYRVYRLREDPDDPDLGARSGVTLQLSRSLTPTLVAEVRGGWQRNESRVTGRYYEKTTIAAGVRYSSPVR